jgi:HTH-type transcriptional regulator/antitoxin MqsA
MTNCPLCNGLLERTVIATSYPYKGVSIVIDQPQDFCSACDEGFLSHTDIQATKKELADFKRKQDGLLISSEIRAIRKKSGLTQTKAAEIFGGGIRAFHRYETGEITQSKTTDLLLKMLAKNIVSVDELIKIAEEPLQDIGSYQPSRSFQSHIYA